MLRSSIPNTARSRLRGIVLGLACVACGSCPHDDSASPVGEAEGESSVTSDSSDGASASAAGLPDVGSDACKDAVVLDASDFAEPDRDWVISSAEDAAPLVNAREVVGAFVVDGDGIDELPEFPCLETVGTIWVQKTRLRDLTAFAALKTVREVFFIKQNGELEGLEGLGNLEEVGETFSITSNPALESLDGLSSLRRAGVFDLKLNDALWDLKGMPPIEAGLILVAGNIRHLQELAGTVSDAYGVTSNVLESIEGLPIAPKMRRVALGGGTFDSLEPLSGLEECSLLQISGNQALESLDGLQSLQRIVDYDGTPGFLSIVGNPKLRDLSALANLTIAESAIEIDNNESLLDLTGLESVTNARQVAITANLTLQNIDAIRLGALESVEEYIRVTSNWALPECQGQALCAAFPNASCQVANNDTESTAGC